MYLYLQFLCAFVIRGINTPLLADCMSSIAELSGGLLSALTDIWANKKNCPVKR